MEAYKVEMQKFKRAEFMISFIENKSIRSVTFYDLLIAEGEMKLCHGLGLRSQKAKIAFSYFLIDQVPKTERFELKSKLNEVLRLQAEQSPA
ncbi:MAG: hypothetical protein H7318_12830 [Oligoflexus sp.]|nr:hypothetical protein [Oligoflexus sp.]